MGRPTVAEINLDNLEHNLDRLREHLSPGTKILAVVKADAYGHGAVSIAGRLRERGIGHFGVATVEEGEELREGIPKDPILVMGGVHPDQLPLAEKRGLETVVASFQHLRALKRSSDTLKRRVGVHLKVDTGMGRLGIFPDELEAACSLVKKSRFLRLSGIMSHLSSADGTDVADMECTRNQLEQVRRGVTPLPEKGVMVHVLNSAGIFRFSDFQFHMVRPGISLYGSRPNHEFEDMGLLPVMTLMTKIYYIKDYPKDHPISYGRKYITRKKEKIAVLPIGYADGMRRILSPGFEVYVEGKPSPVVGTICMDNTMIDVTHIPDAKVGSEVMIFGKKWNIHSPVEDVAKRAGTIPYAILTGITKRVPRTYIS